MSHAYSTTRNLRTGKTARMRIRVVNGLHTVSARAYFRAMHVVGLGVAEHSSSALVINSQGHEIARLQGAVC